MDKKAEISDYMIAFIPRIIFIIIVLASIYLLINAYIKTEVNTFDAESNLFVQRLLYSKNGVSYKDKDTGQVYPGIIEISRCPDFTEALAQSIHYYDSGHLAAKVTITNMRQEEICSFYYNRERFDQLTVLSKFSGGGGSKMIVRKLYVLLKAKTNVEIVRLQNQLGSLQDEFQQDLRQKLSAQLEETKKAQADNSLVQGYLEMTVVMPNS